MVGEEGAQAAEARVDALHATPLVGVGDLPPDPFLLFHDLAGWTGAARLVAILILFLLFFDHLANKSLY